MYTWIVNRREIDGSFLSQIMALLRKWPEMADIGLKSQHPCSTDFLLAVSLEQTPVVETGSPRLSAAQSNLQALTVCPDKPSEAWM